MIGFAFCFVAFVATFRQTRRSLGAGMVALLSIGYSYGLLRARVSDVGGHFIFDAALAGLYAAAFTTSPDER